MGKLRVPSLIGLKKLFPQTLSQFINPVFRRFQNIKPLRDDKVLPIIFLNSILKNSCSRCNHSIKIGYKGKVLCEFMRGSFVVVLDLLFLVPTFLTISNNSGPGIGRHL